MIGARPHPGRRFDRSTDLWPLALISFGESWHNGHHAAPACARHGSRPHQIDLSAGLIGAFERLGWATGVHWPAPPRPARDPDAFMLPLQANCRQHDDQRSILAE
jgi:stearoyl-CoA desaturase (delta-9 desaturase)